MYYTLKFLFGNIKTSDVLYFTVYRTPIVKLASYAVAKVNVSSKDGRKILEQISNHQDLVGDVEIWFAKNDSDPVSKQQLITRKKYAIVYASPVTQIGNTIVEHKYHLTTTLYLILVNPILMQMQRNILINKIYENKTCKQILEEVENEFKQAYGDIFKFEKQIQGFNPYVYEQVLINSLHDIEIPTWLINTYKLSDGYPVYFFDDFDLHNVDKPIRAIAFDPTNFGNFKCCDTSSLIENWGATPIRKYPIKDLFENAVKSQDRQILLNSEFKQCVNCVPTSLVESGVRGATNYTQDPNSMPRFPGNKPLCNSSVGQIFTKSTPGAKQRSTGWIPDHIEHYKKRKKAIEEAFKKKYREVLLVKYTGAPIDIFKIASRYPIVDSKGKMVNTNTGLIGSVISFKRITLRESKMQAVATCQYLIFSQG